jgi:hypothetical protein
MTDSDQELYWGTPDSGDIHIFDSDVDARSLCGKWNFVTPAIQEPIDIDAPRFPPEKVCWRCYHRVDWDGTESTDDAADVEETPAPSDASVRAITDLAIRWDITLPEAEAFLEDVGYFDAQQRDGGETDAQ